MILDKNSSGGVEEGVEFYVYHKDALGSVMALTNSSGDLVETYRYDSFGKPLDITWDATWKSVHPFKNPFRYTAREVNGEIYYYRNRYYDPHTRRFLTEDPLRFVDGVNRYAYVGNNPVNFIDPWGLQDTPNVGDLIGGLQDAADDWATGRLGGDVKRAIEEYEQNLPQGMTQGKVMGLLGRPSNVLKSGDGEVMEYRIDNFKNSKFLQKYNMPLYYGKYEFVDNRLVEFSFGFGYP